MKTPGDSAPGAAADNVAPDGAANEGATAAPAAERANPPRPAGGVKRGVDLRRELVAKLGQLPVSGDSAGAMKVDPSAVDLDADAFIGPLNTLVSEGRS